MESANLTSFTAAALSPLQPNRRAQRRPSQEGDLMSLGTTSPRAVQTDGTVSPEEDMSMGAEARSSADDHAAMMEKHLAPLDDLETLSNEAYDWHIEDWRALERRTVSPTFDCGGFQWRILLFPGGNTSADCCAAYLECLDGAAPATEDDEQPDWACCAQFSLILWNKNDPTIYSAQTASHRFTPEEADWGFSRFYDLRKLACPHEDRDRPIVEAGETMISAYVNIVKDPTGVLWHNFNNYDSKKATGHVGLKNQGATCYMNSLLQSLYFTNYFRKAVYQIPTENDDPKNSIALALQRIFYQMEKSDEAASTSELTQSFGWSSLDAFMQHDVQEFNRVLQDNLEGKMKKTAAENALSRLFVGKMKSYIKCVNVDYESAREEEFWDIQLNVKGMKNLKESFADYVQVETLDGDNKYFAEGFGLQDAKKGVIFQDFPPVLHLQLKRFEYDMERDAMVKINDRHEFPLEIDLTEFLDETADLEADWNYKLHGVLVHSGDLHGGHYYALLKPEKNDRWYRFDDDRVTPCTLKEVLDENFGGVVAPSVRMPNRPLQGKRFMNAYMLVYIRESRLGEILEPVAESDIPGHVSARIEEELAEEVRRRKEREEMHLYLWIRTLTLQDFYKHDGFDLVDTAESALPLEKVQKTMTYGEYKQKVAKARNVSVERVRHWVMVNRQNKTIRPDTVLGPSYDNKTLVEVRDEVASRRAEIFLYLEIVEEKDVGFDLADGQQETARFLLFVKHFDVDAQTLSGLTTMHLLKQEKIEVALERLAPLISKEPTGIRLYEEIKPGMIDLMRPKSTFAQSEVVDGDIVTVQRHVDETERLALQKQGKFSVAPEYYDFCHNKLAVTLLPRSAEQTVTEKFELTMSRKSTYDQVVTKIGEHLKVDPSHIRLSAVGVGNQPRQPFKALGSMTLHNMLQPGYLQAPVMALAYEVLETSLKELDSKKLLKISYLPEGLLKEVPVEILVPKINTIEDAVNLLAAKLQLSSDQAQSLRIYETHSNKYHKHSDPTASVLGLQDYMTLYAEHLSEDDAKQSETDRQVNVMHFQKEPSRSHGVPFVFWLRKGETWSEARSRLQRKTRYKDDDFKKVKGAVISPSSVYAKPTYLEDEDVPWDLFKMQDDVLGLDHLDKTVKPSRYGERAIKITG